VIDKGTFDSILCGDGSGPNSEQMLSEVYRVLSPTGVYICISYGIPEQRNAYFQNPNFDWEVQVHKVAKPTISTSAVVAKEEKNEKNFHYIYVMRKKVGPKADAPAESQ
jgi:ubiquinone/menaquinone biosynthesis C-methylase UbiE